MIAITWALDRRPPNRWSAMALITSSLPILPSWSSSYGSPNTNCAAAVLPLPSESTATSAATSTVTVPTESRRDIECVDGVTVTPDEAAGYAISHYDVSHLEP